jgi:hypothetical protein
MRMEVIGDLLPAPSGYWRPFGDFFGKSYLVVEIIHRPISLTVLQMFILLSEDEKSVRKKLPASGNQEDPLVQSPTVSLEKSGIFVSNFLEAPTMVTVNTVQVINYC